MNMKKYCNLLIFVSSKIRFKNSITISAVKVIVTMITNESLNRIIARNMMTAAYSGQNKIN
jgi:hypothetical protein